MVKVELSSPADLGYLSVNSIIITSDSALEKKQAL